MLTELGEEIRFEAFPGRLDEGAASGDWRRDIDLPQKRVRTETKDRHDGKATDRPRRSDPTPEQRAAFEQSPRGRAASSKGPCRVWLQSPALAETAQALGPSAVTGPSCPKIRRLAIPRDRRLLALGLSNGRCMGPSRGARAYPRCRRGDSSAVNGQNFPDPTEEAIYDFASELHRDHRVRDETYARITDLCGQEGAVELTGILGYYTLIVR